MWPQKVVLDKFVIREKIQDLVKDSASELWPDFFAGGAGVIIEKPDNSALGDYAVSIAFALGKKLGKNPKEVADLLAEKLSDEKPAEIEKIEAVGGYVNFFLAGDFLKKELAEIYENRESYGRSDTGRGKKIVIDYSAPNIAKPMHVGHLRSTIIGDALANIYGVLGYEVVRWNYLGDWGTQFGKLIAAYNRSELGNKKDVPTIQDLVKLYVNFHHELLADPEGEENAGQREFQKLEAGDKKNRKLWKMFRDESLREFQRMYQLLGVHTFTVTKGESAYEKDLAPTVADLKEKGIAEIGEGGSVIVKLDKFNLPPALVQKSDGASLYITRDIALLKDRIKKYKPEKILYVVANQQTLHFQQLFAIAEILGLDGAKLEHIKFGLVLGEDKKKLSTREGNAVALEEVVAKAINLARDVVENKSAERQTPLSAKEKEEIAQTVAIGALKYQDLKEHRNSDIVFDWKKMLDFAGSSGPYLQYTYARLSNIKNKAGEISAKPDFNLLTEKIENSLVKHFLDFPDVLREVGETNLPNHLALYLYELANLANRFYETVPVLKDKNLSRLAARLVLVETTAAILKTGLGLLGIGVLEKI